MEFHTLRFAWVAITKHIYEVRPRKDKRGVDLICDTQDTSGALPNWKRAPDNAKENACWRVRGQALHAIVVRVYDATSNVIVIVV